MARYDFLVIGGGIIGLATAYTLLKRYPKARVAVLEKEATYALHQSGRNSGVLHSGLYYAPDSLKAKLCKEGREELIAFCKAYRIPFQITGKLVVATYPLQLPHLSLLYERGLAHGLTLKKLNAEQIKELEPHVTQALEGFSVAETGLVDFSEVCHRLSSLIQQAGGYIATETEVINISPRAGGYLIETNEGPYETQYLINAAGLFADRIARLAGENPPCKIIPFRGGFYKIGSQKSNLIQHMIYPVPNPKLPFLGVHLTKHLDTSLHAGPNAVLAFKREGYLDKDFVWQDFVETMTYSGFWKMSLKYAKTGFEELFRSWQKNRFLKAVQALVPEIEANDLTPEPSGVRAQAVYPNGRLVEDFEIMQQPYALHVVNAPSPAATASFAIAKNLVERIPHQVHLKETKYWQERTAVGI